MSASTELLSGYVKIGARAWRWVLSSRCLVVGQHSWRCERVSDHLWSLTGFASGRATHVFALLTPHHTLEIVE